MEERWGMKKNQHVVPQNGHWAVRGEGSSKASRLFEKQADAINHARDSKNRERLYREWDAKVIVED
jgi:hypothetical protein